MRGHLLAVGTALTILMAAQVNAAPLVFDFAGPSGTALFQLDSNPTPDFTTSFLGSDTFGFNNVAGTFGGTAGTASVISFGRGSIFSTLSITAPHLGFTQFVAPVLFTGALTAPVFLTGSFTVVNPFVGNGTLSITPAQGIVPEPATWALLLVGFGIVGGMVRYRRRSVAGKPMGHRANSAVE